MKKNKITFISISITTLCSAIILLSFYFAQNFGTPKFYFTRTYDSTSLSFLKRIKFQSEGPTKILVNKDRLFIYDIKEKVIKIITIEGNNIKSVGKNNDGDKQIILLMDLAADSAKLSLLDVRNHGILNYSQDDKMIGFDTIGIFTRGVFTKKGVLILIPNKKSDYDFKLFDTATKKLASTKIIFHTYQDNGFTNDGFFKANGKNILYTFYHIGKFMIIDTSLTGNTLYSTVDNYDKSAQVVRFGKRTYLSQKTPNINFDAAIDDDFVYIISYIKSEDDKRKKIKGLIIDQYNLQGKYVKSLLLKNLPNSFISFDIKEKKLYCLCTTEILVYQMN